MLNVVNTLRDDAIAMEKLYSILNWLLAYD